MSSRHAEKQQKRNFSDISDTESDLEENERPEKNKKLIKASTIKSKKDDVIRKKPLSAVPIANVTNADADSDSGDSTTGEIAPNIDKNVPEAEKLKLDDKKTKAKYLKPFTDEMLIGPEGLLRIYEEFPKAATFQGRGSEAKFIKRLMTLYKEWAFQLHPGVAFNDVLAKCESLGSKSRTRNYITKLRDDERNRYLKDVYGFKESESAPTSLESANLMETAATTTASAPSSAVSATEVAAVDASVILQTTETNGADDNANHTAANSAQGDDIAAHDESQRDEVELRQQDYVEEEVEEESPNFLNEVIAMGESY